MRRIPSLALIISSAALLAACSSTKEPEKAPQQDKPVETTTQQPDTRAVQPVQTGTQDDLNTNPALAKRSVYFDFDKYDVRDDARPVVESHGKYLSNHKDRHILIQGNTDERGGSEYNLALGQKRAEAVRKALSVLGASDSQMEAVSLGKEKPKATGHDEAAWQENRRADIVYN